MVNSGSEVVFSSFGGGSVVVVVVVVARVVVVDKVVDSEVLDRPLLLLEKPNVGLLELICLRTLLSVRLTARTGLSTDEDGCT